jgi:hypothetical protein
VIDIFVFLLSSGSSLHLVDEQLTLTHGLGPVLAVKGVVEEVLDLSDAGGSCNVDFGTGVDLVSDQVRIRHYVRTMCCPSLLSR